MKKKIVSLLVISTMIVSSTQIAFAEETKNETLMDNKEIYSTIDNMNTEELDEDVLGNAIVNMQEIGFDIVDINQSQQGIEVETALGGAEQEICISEATDEKILINIESDGLKNEVCIRDDGRMFVDGHEITSKQELVTTEQNLTAGDLSSNRRTVTYRTTPSYGKSSDYTTHHIYRRVISLGEKAIYAFTLAAFMMVMGKELLAAGLVVAEVEAWGGLVLNTVLSQIIAFNPYTTAFSMQDIVGYHRIKGKIISPVLTVVKHCTTFYCRKDYKYPTGPSKTFFEESWLDVGI